MWIKIEGKSHIKSCYRFTESRTNIFFIADLASRGTTECLSLLRDSNSMCFKRNSEGSRRSYTSHGSKKLYYSTSIGVELYNVTEWSQFSNSSGKDKEKKLLSWKVNAISEIVFLYYLGKNVLTWIHHKKKTKEKKRIYINLKAKISNQKNSHQTKLMYNINRVINYSNNICLHFQKRSHLFISVPANRK